MWSIKSVEMASGQANRHGHRRPVILVLSVLILLLCHNSGVSSSRAGDSLDIYSKMFNAAPIVDPCYDEDRPRRCVPDFVNAAFGAPVKASTTCGEKKPSFFCEMISNHNNNHNELGGGSFHISHRGNNGDSANAGGGGGGISGSCQTCDGKSSKYKFAASALTDLNNPNNVTCWRSEPITVLEGPVGGGGGGYNVHSRLDNVSLTLSLGKKFELTYISLQFCPRSPKPDSIAIYKSSDYGMTWKPFQYYSSNCRRVYGLPNRATITKSNEQEARCSDFLRHDGNTNSQTGGRIAFSVLDGRPSANDYENSATLQDWNTVTDVRVVFNRMYPPGDADFGFGGGNGGSSAVRGNNLRRLRKLNKQKRNIAIDRDNANNEYDEEDDEDEDLEDTEDTLMVPEGGSNNILEDLPLLTTYPSTSTSTATSSSSSSSGGPEVMAVPKQYHYAVSDLAVGGRCKCNGHGSKCVPGEDGQLTCECKHNTAGKDCERCKPFFFDRPWGRATTRDVNECKGECQFGWSNNDYYYFVLVWMEFED